MRSTRTTRSTRSSFNVAVSGSGGTSLSGSLTPAQAFLARTSGLDGTHTTAYTTLINGLVTDDVWAKLDLLQIYATQDQATASLNLKSSSYTIVPPDFTGSPVWAADVGYTTASGKYIDTNYNLSTGLNLTQNSAHISAWSGTPGLLAAGRLISSNSAIPSVPYILPRDTGDRFSGQLNDNSVVGDFGASIDGSGHFLINRPDSSSRNGYKTGLFVGTVSRASIAPVNANLITSGNASISTAAFIVRAVSAGAALTTPQVLAFYNRLAAYMTAVGASP